MNRKVLGVPLPLAILGLVVLLVVVLIVVNLGNISDFLTDPDRITDDEIVVCAESNPCSVWYPIGYSVFLILVLLTGFAYTTWIERRFLASLQDRVGPNRVGPQGLLQPVADGIKLIFKEDIIPAQARKAVYLAAPVLKVAPVLIVMAVIPFGPDILIPWFNSMWYQVPLGVADLNVGILWILAITSLATYGVVLAGWSSNNKYSMIGGLRASAQMISYELSMGLALAVPIMLASSMSIKDIIDAQSGSPLNWFVFQNPLAAGILMIALVAEVNRSPFDLPEAEQELTAGYMTEYSGMKFAAFMMAEYVGMIAISSIAVSTFFGGYHFFMVDQVPILGPFVMAGKVIVLLVLLVWTRGTLPRLRYDRLMAFGWKLMLPLALVAVCWTAVAVVVGDEYGSSGYSAVSIVMFVLVMGWLFFTRSSDPDKAENDLANDPMITGERSGFVYGIIELTGAIIAVPFLMYNFVAKAMDGLTNRGRITIEEDDNATV